MVKVVIIDGTVMPWHAGDNLPWLMNQIQSHIIRYGMFGASNLLRI